MYASVELVHYGLQTASHITHNKAINIFSKSMAIISHCPIIQTQHTVQSISETVLPIHPNISFTVSLNQLSPRQYVLLSFCYSVTLPFWFMLQCSLTAQGRFIQ